MPDQNIGGFQLLDLIITELKSQIIKKENFLDITTLVFCYQNFSDLL